MTYSIPDEGLAVGHIAELFDGIQGEGVFAGYHHAFIRFAGCSLGCRYCDTEYAQVRDRPLLILRSGRTVVKQIANPVDDTIIARELESLLDTTTSINAISITGGEPLEQPRFLRAVLKSIETFELPVLLETNGVEFENLDQVLDLIDLISADIKLPSTSGRDDLWERHEAFLNAARYKQVAIKMAVDESTQPEEIERAARIIRATTDEAPVFLQPVTDAAGAITISYRHIMDLCDVCAVFNSDVRVMPQIHKILGSP
ncbi:MAG: 7-carboxy-7-deazaguanine synthase QueE [Candidatus Coatesbacteria bacterium]|nr:7-carboxy-7-deazaguanine synthase QueE [Candidatus Coatesbacteria bacterium]